MASLEQRFKDFSDKVSSKLNQLKNDLGEVIPWKGLSPNNGQSLTTDTEGKVYFKERTPEEIASAYEGLTDRNRFSNAHKSTVESFEGQFLSLEGKLDKGGNTTDTAQSLREGVDGNTSELENQDTRIGEIEGLGLFANQSAQEIYIRNASGATLSTLSVAFLNNEGTTFFYNETTEKLELKNDQGQVLSEVPVGAFVSNLAVTLTLSGNKLSLRDNEGNEVDFVEFEISNISGLAAALGSKANTNEVIKGVRDSEGNLLTPNAQREVTLPEIPDLGLTESDVKNTKRGYTKQQYFVEQELTDATTLSWDLDTQQTARLLLTSAVGASRLLPASILTKAEPGASYQLTVKQDSTGNREIDFSEFDEVYGALNLEPNGVSTVSLWQSQGGNFVTITSKASVLGGLNLTGTSIHLGNVGGNNYNYSSPSSATTYTIVSNSAVTNGFARCFINAASEPTVTGATKLNTGGVFIANTDMELAMDSPDGVNVEYYFLER